jgi:DNA-directed RNA polymerase subunit RPC12/RpoP
LDRGEADTEHHLTCRRCGSDKLRRSHSRSRLQKLFRRTTTWDRYACGSCGHRGWIRGRVPRREVASPARSPQGVAQAGSRQNGGRRLEKRDHRLRRRLRLRTTVAMGLSLLLGIVAALYLQRCGAAPPPVE